MLLVVAVQSLLRKAIHDHKNLCYYLSVRSKVKLETCSKENGVFMFGCSSYPRYLDI